MDWWKRGKEGNSQEDAAQTQEKDDKAWTKTGKSEKETTSQIFKREVKQDWCLLHGRHEGEGGPEDDLGVRLREETMEGWPRILDLRD